MNQETSKLVHLEKGKACFNCRRRKVKCDARRPICTPCSKFLRGGLHDCEYTERGPAQSQMLEEKISILQSRIQEMENPMQQRSSVGLHSPYYPEQSRQRSVSPDRLRLFSSSPPPLHYAGPSIGNSGSLVPPLPLPHPSHRFIVSTWQAGPVSIALARNLIASFSTHLSSLGVFFLNPHLFDPLVDGRGIHPTQIASPALLDAVCLWGAHLHSSPLVGEPISTESNLLTTALRSASTSLTHAHTPAAILQALQAHVLLSVYLFRAGRGVEASYHAGLAVSIVMGAGLWRIRSGRNTSSAQMSVHGTATIIEELTPVVSPAEEGGRIDAFWAVVALNASWIRIPNMPLTPPSLEHALVDTPWPVEKAGYAENSRILPERSTRTIVKFLTNEGASSPYHNSPSENISLPAMYAKATIVYEQAVRAGHGSSLAAQSQFRSTPAAHWQALEEVIERLRSILQHVNVNPRTLLVHSLVQAASIALHLTPARSARRKAVEAASEMVRLVGAGGVVGGTGYLDAVFGTLWSSACDVFLSEMTSQPQNRGYRESIETLLAAMEVLKRQGCRMVELPMDGARARYAATTTRKRG
ncbi:hypothetical protein C8F01DRAFT_1141166 [Mycena amicta]|nr:hypothetical protein C8F01DRAFT_1141166 [Mycena amicta]